MFHLMICKRIEWFIEKQKILAPVTSGFRKCQSCLDCLVRLVSGIQIGFSKDISTLAVFLDVESAYNNVLTDQLVIMLDNLNIGSQTCKYLWSFLSNRFLKIKDNDDDPAMVRWTGRGLAQGDPLSPLLFNIVTHNICAGYDNVNVLQYADDLVLYTQNRNSSLNEAYIQNALNFAVVKLERLGLEISSTKTQCCSFRRGTKIDRVNLTINNNNVTAVTNVKYLGIWLDKSLLWRKHINETFEKTMKMISMLKVLAGVSWGVHPKHLRRLYIALIRSRIDYGCFLYDTAAKTHLSKLDRVQNIAMRVIGGFIKTTPIHVMQCEVCIQPLQFRRQYLATKYCLKAQSFSNNMTLTLFNDLLDLRESRYWLKKSILISIFEETQSEKLVSCDPVNIFSLNTWVSNIKLDFIQTKVEGIDQAKSQFDDIELKSHTLFMLNGKYKNWHKLFTDGSKTGGSAGAAFYDPRRDVKETYMIRSKCNSIMSIELFAISEALSYVSTLESNKVVILTDSLSALQHIARCVHGYRGISIAYTILNKVLMLSGRVSLSLQWIPSHVGIRGNEMADSLAREAISNGAEVYLKPEYSEVLHKYNRRIMNMWKEYFDIASREKGIWYRTMQSEPPNIPWFANIMMNRKFVVIAHRLRSGHIPSNKFKFLMKLVDTPNCTDCGVVEDVHHVLMECARNAAQRRDSLLFNNSEVGICNSLLALPASGEAREMIYLYLSSLEDSL